jgi:hypothetical protein
VGHIEQKVGLDKNPVSVPKVTKAKGLGAWLKWWSACLTSMRTQVKLPVLPKDKEKENNLLPIILLYPPLSSTL